MKTRTMLALVAALCTSVTAAPTVSNVHAQITSITDNGKGMKTRSFVATFDLANTNGQVCRVFPGVRGAERNPVLADEGPYLWYTNVAGDTATSAGTGKRITFTVVDTAGEFDSVRVKITAWDRENWPPWPNRTFNPRHHGWALDVRSGTVSAKSDGFITDFKGSPSPAFLQVLFDFSVFRVMGNHQKALPAITDFPDESDSMPVPFPHTTLGDPYNAYPEGNFASGDCSNDGDCHIEITDAEWVRRNTAWFIVPFVDKDGVEDGDQGKARAPRDHGRDYEGQSLYATTAAIRAQLPEWSAGRLHLALDLHCPHISGPHNEVIYVVGSRRPETAREQQRFSGILESQCRGPLPFSASDFLPFGVDWNSAGNYTGGRGFSSWAAELPGMVLALAMEIPYANARGAEVNQKTARLFGRDLGAAIASYLKAPG